MAPSASTAAASESAATSEAPATSGEPSATPVPTPLPGDRLGGQAGRRRHPLVLLPRHRRRARAGRGRAARSPTTFNTSHPGIHLRFEGYPYQLRARRAVGPARVGQRSGHRRPGRHRRRQGVPRPVARPPAAHRQEPVRHEPSSRIAPSTCTTSAARARSASRTRSTRRSCSTRPSLFKEAGLNEPPHEWNATYTMPDGIGRAVGLRHRPQDRPDPDRRQERQGRDRGRVRPGEHRPVGLRAAARRHPPDRRLLEGRQRSSPPTARPSRSPTPGPPPGTTFYDGIWKDHISGHRAAVPQHRLQPERLPVLHRARSR